MITRSAWSHTKTPCGGCCSTRISVSLTHSTHPEAGSWGLGVWHTRVWSVTHTRFHPRTTLGPCISRWVCGVCVRPYPEYSRANSYPWSPFPPRRARPGPGPHRGCMAPVRSRDPRGGGVWRARWQRSHGGQSINVSIYRGSSLIRKRLPIGPYRIPMPGPMVVRGGWVFLMSEVPLYTGFAAPGFWGVT